MAQWQKVDQLVGEQKYEAASKVVAEVLEASRQQGDERSLTRALVKATQLRLALGGYETSVRFLKEQEWPKAPRHRLVLQLFYGHSLFSYLQAYSWEINRREEITGEAGEGLKTWTADRIGQEIHSAYLSAFTQRREWGEQAMGDLSAYVQEGDYPPRLRGTLRDAVSYLWVSLLADTSRWQPEASNELYRLDLKALVADAVAADETATERLSDAETHPLEKIRILLADLEAWHISRSQPEAALEARLELHRQLMGSFSTHEDDRLLLRNDLEQRLAAFDRGLPWWAMGQSQLAEMWRQEIADPMHLVKAREIALEGAGSSVESVGKRRCVHLAASFEQPQINMTAMAVDGPEKRSIELQHANLERVFFRAYKVDPVEMLNSKRRQVHPSRQEVEGLLTSNQVMISWHRDLPPTPDLKSHRTFVTPPLKDPGAYIIVSSLRDDFRDRGNARSAVYFLLSDLVLISRPFPENNAWEITVRSGANGDPRGVPIEVYRLDWRGGHKLLSSHRTNNQGRVRLGSQEWGRHTHMIVARLGEHVATTQLYGSPRSNATKDQQGALIYTDRSVYRPDQEVQWKVVAYRGGKAGNFQTAEDATLTVQLFDANGEIVARESVTTNKFGSASGVFTATAGRLLGSWSLGTSWGGRSSVRVEEYKRPTFEVEITEPSEALRLNHTVTLRGQADYYFGLPVSVGEAQWRITREPVYPTWRWWSPVPPSEPRVIAHGTAALDQDGGFEVVFVPEADPRQSEGDREISYSYRLSAEVTDDGGETRNASRAVRIGFVAIDAALEAVRPFTVEGEEASVRITRRLLSGAPAQGGGNYRVMRLEQPAETLLPAELPVEPAAAGVPRTEGDELRPRWNVEVATRELLRSWPLGEEVAAGEVSHDASGIAEVSSLLPAGAYRLIYETCDELGAEIERELDLIVAGKEKLAVPAILMAESTSVEPGGVARFLVHSGFRGQKMLFEVFRGDQRTDSRVLSASAAPQVLEVPVGMDSRGGFGVRLTVLRDHQLMNLRQSVDVPWVDRRLEVSFERFRDKLKPGSEETFTVTVRGRGEQGEWDVTVDPATLELMAYMFDRSLDLFAKHSPPQPISLYPRQRWVPTVAATLGVAPVIMHLHRMSSLPGYPSLRTSRLRFFDGWPIGGPGSRRGGPVMRTMAMASPDGAPSPPPPAPRQSGPMKSKAAPAESVLLEANTVVADDAGFEGDVAGGEASVGDEPVRSNFAETAFWMPHVRLASDGSAQLEFTVPDSVTEWSVWAHALTRDLRSGSVEKKTRSAKDLLIRPYLPRFLREGDRAELRMVVSNAGDEPLSGQVDVTLEDAESGDDLLASFGLTRAQVSDLAFAVEPGATTTLTVPLIAPKQPGSVAVTARAKSQDLTDGERRPLPVLPSRLYLAQSRFAAVRGPSSRTLRFEDLATDDDPSRETESLIVTLDGQLFGSVLRAVPYLVDYPYQCTEQNLNRYLSTGILSRLYDDHPSVATLAARLAAERDTPLEPWNEEDPNRRLLLEETPWLRHSQGGEDVEGLLKVLDPEIARQVRTRALAEVVKAQTSSGGFPWWPGGPPSPYMTFYVLQGFSRALEFGLDVPRDVVARAWSYVADYWKNELSIDIADKNCCAPELTMLSWLLSAYPDAQWMEGAFRDSDRQRILDLAFEDWQKLSPRLKGYLALALVRGGRSEKGRMVWESVMDSAKSDPDLGIYWAPEERAWLWYNDTVETQAFALRVLMELNPADERRHGLAQWLLLDKKLGHWKSTRATAEALFALAAYLKAEGSLGIRETVSVNAGSVAEKFELDPEENGRRQLVIKGEEVTPSMAEIEVGVESESLLFASATWHFATDRLPEEARGDFFHVERSYFRRVLVGDAWQLQPLAEGAQIAVGDQMEVRLSMRTKHAAEYVHLRDPRGAGFEPVDTSSGWSWTGGLSHYREIRDSGMNYFFEWLPVGEYTFRYRVRATTAGTFRVAPAQVQSMYAPEFVAYSSGRQLDITP